MNERISGTPTVVDLQVVPVAGQDGMLLNPSGAHGPRWTRNIDHSHSADDTGLGEAPDGTAIEDASPFVVGRSSNDYDTALNTLHSAFAERDAGGPSLQAFELRATIQAATAVESALLDRLGQNMHAPDADLLGEGLQRDAVAMQLLIPGWTFNNKRPCLVR